MNAANRIANLDGHVRYAAAVGAVAIAWLLRTFVLTQAVDRSPFLAFGLAVLLAAIVGGFGPGLLALALSTVLAIFFYLPPELALAVHDPFDAVQLGFFLTEGLLAATAGEAIHRGALARGRPERSVLLPRDPMRTAPGLVEPLTEREAEIAHLLAAGYSNEEMAASLFLSVNTVKSHLKNLYGKLGVRSRAQAVSRCHELGLLARAEDTREATP